MAFAQVVKIVLGSEDLTMSKPIVSQDRMYHNGHRVCFRSAQK